ncbi:uncharacterized protein DS421_3g88180 [Arachis hypogaea]|nr:uncharacterized protein DS421_3g88180 [Arachis hypogaea]
MGLPNSRRAFHVMMVIGPVLFCEEPSHLLGMIGGAPFGCIYGKLFVALLGARGMQYLGLLRLNQGERPEDIEPPLIERPTYLEAIVIKLGSTWPVRPEIRSLSNLTEPSHSLNRPCNEPGGTRQPCLSVSSPSFEHYKRQSLTTSPHHSVVSASPRRHSQSQPRLTSSSLSVSVSPYRQSQSRPHLISYRKRSSRSISASAPSGQLGGIGGCQKAQKAFIKKHLCLYSLGLVGWYWWSSKSIHQELNLCLSASAPSGLFVAGCYVGIELLLVATVLELFLNLVVAAVVFSFLGLFVVGCCVGIELLLVAAVVFSTYCDF